MDGDLTEPATGSAYLRRVLTFWGLLVAVLLVVLMTALSEPFEPDGFGPGQDARAYWAAPLARPYEPGSVGHESAYLYSPAFLVAMSPLRALPWPHLRGALDGHPAGGALLADRTASLPAPRGAGHAGDLGRQHHHPPGGRHRRRAAAPGRLGLPAAHQGDARPRHPVVRGAPRMVPVPGGAGSDGGRHRRHGRHHAGPLGRLVRAAHAAAPARAPSPAPSPSRCSCACRWRPWSSSTPPERARPGCYRSASCWPCPSSGGAA